MQTSWLPLTNCMALAVSPPLPPSDEGGGFCPTGKTRRERKTNGKNYLPSVINLKYCDGSFDNRQKLHLGFTLILLSLSQKLKIFDSASVGASASQRRPVGTRTSSDGGKGFLSTVKLKTDGNLYFSSIFYLALTTSKV